MKIVFLVLLSVAATRSAVAQLKTTPACPPFTIDLLEGNINQKLRLNSTMGEVIKIFPCFTDSVEETNGAGCGGVFYKDKDLRFFTERDYIEIGEKFKGQLSPAIMGADRSGLFKILGNPRIKDVEWDAFQTSYGIMVVYYNKEGKINKLQISNKSTDNLKLCE
jgi:hypothetical protein